MYKLFGKCLAMFATMKPEVHGTSLLHVIRLCIMLVTNCKLDKTKLVSFTVSSKHGYCEIHVQVNEHFVVCYYGLKMLCHRFLKILFEIVIHFSYPTDNSKKYLNFLLYKSESRARNWAKS